MAEFWTGETNHKLIINNHASTIGKCILYADDNTPLIVNSNYLNKSYLSLSGLGSSETLSINISNIDNLTGINSSYYNIYAYTVNDNHTYSNIAYTQVSIFQTNNITAPTDISLQYNETKQLSITQTSNAYYKGVTYTSNNNSIVTVNSNGQMRGINVGNTTIRVSPNDNHGETKIINVNVNKASNKITPSKTSVELNNDITSDIITLSVNNGSLSANISEGSDKIRISLTDNKLVISLINATIPTVSSASINIINTNVSSNYNTASSIKITVSINIKDSGDNSTSYYKIL